MRRFQAPQIPFSKYASDNDPELSSDSYPLLTTNHPSPLLALSRHKHVVELDTELVDVDAPQDPGNGAGPQSRWGSSWTTYNPFSSRGRQLLSRKVRSSGPATDKDIDHVEQSALTKPRGVTGWRAGTRLCCFAVVLCIAIEFVLLIWAVVPNGHNSTDGLVWEGRCDVVRKLELWLLLPLNIAATVLIGTSNYVMQVMSAPDREEIDQAHRYATPLAVGGIRFKMSKYEDPRAYKRGKLRRTVWWVLVISSLPIHLLLNVAFYGSVQSSNTGVVVVSEDFMDDPTWSYCTSKLTESSISANLTCSMKQFFDSGQTRQLSASECKSQYARGFQTNASSAIVVTDKVTNPWYNLPRSAKISSSYGLPCEYSANSFELVAVPDAERLYQFIYDESTGNVTVDLSLSFCDNITNSRSSPAWSLRENDIAFTPCTSLGALLLRENDTLTNISSIRASQSTA